MIVIFLLYAVLALTFTINKLVLWHVPPFLFISIRMICSGILLLSIHHYLYGAKTKQLSYRALGQLLALSVFHITIPYGTEIIALEHIAPSCSALLYNMSPFFTALCSAWYVKERITWSQIGGMFIGFCGVWYLTNPVQCTAYTYYLLITAGVITSSASWVYIKKLIAEYSYSIMYINGITMLCGGLQALMLSYWQGEASVSISDFIHNPMLIGWLVLLLVISNLFYNAYGWLLKSYSATMLSCIGMFTPLFVAFFDMLFISIPMPNHFLGALCLASIGTYIFYRKT